MSFSHLSYSFDRDLPRAIPCPGGVLAVQRGAQYVIPQQYRNYPNHGLPPSPRLPLVPHGSGGPASSQWQYSSLVLPRANVRLVREDKVGQTTASTGCVTDALPIYTARPSSLPAGADEAGQRPDHGEVVPHRGLVLPLPGHACPRPSRESLYVLALHARRPNIRQVAQVGLPCSRSTRRRQRHTGQVSKGRVASEVTRIVRFVLFTLFDGRYGYVTTDNELYQ